MMNIQTTRFGELELEEQEVLTFPSGIPGFQHLQQYTVISLPESPFYYIQSVEEGSLAFIAVSPFDFFPEYEFTLPDSAQKELEFPTYEELRVLNIVSVSDRIELATANLAAPIVWNASRCIAMQLILQDTSYRTKHPLYSNPSAALKEGV